MAASPLYSVSIPTFAVIVLFLLFIMRPLWLLAKERYALIIMISRAIASTIAASLSDILSVTLVIGIKSNTFITLIFNIMNELDMVITVHTLTMALNRVHCILFPLHYMHFSSKKRIVFQCICTYVISIVLVTCFFLFVNDNDMKKLFKNVVQAGIYILCATIYAIIAVRLFIYKYSKRSWASQQATVEKDCLKITLCCSLSTFMNICAMVLYLDPINESLARLLKPFSPLLYSFYIVFVGTVGAFTEEICLLALCKEFRQKVCAQFGTIWTMVTCGRDLPCEPEPRKPAGQTNVINVNSISTVARMNNFVPSL